MSTLAVRPVPVPRVLADALPGARARDAALVVAGALLTVLGAQISIHVPPSPVPITGQTLAVVLAGAALGARRGAASQGLYILLGFFLPVYADGAQGPESSGAPPAATCSASSWPPGSSARSPSAAWTGARPPPRWASSSPSSPSSGSACHG